MPVKSGRQHFQSTIMKPVCGVHINPMTPGGMCKCMMPCSAGGFLWQSEEAYIRVLLLETCHDGAHVFGQAIVHNNDFTTIKNRLSRQVFEA